MRSNGYSSFPLCVCVCVCVCVSVRPHAILAVRVITSKIKDTIMLNVRFEAIVKKAFFLNMSGSIVRALLLT